VIWLLDTNVLIHAVRGRPRAVRARLQRQSPDDVAVSSITVAELWYGAEKSVSPARKREAWKAVLEPFQVIAFDRDAAEHHARIRYLLRHRPIGERDLLIASIALAQDLTLVTHNVAEFSRVPQLRVEDWAAS
jgi:tRNA(fMet)-specific endonuclease VapC